MIKYLFKESDSVKVKTGYLYHIKDEFFDIANDEGTRNKLILYRYR